MGVGYLTQISTLFEHGSIECLSARPPVRPIIALRQLVDILAGYRLSISGRHRHYEIAYQLAFAAAETYVCRTGCRKHTDIPGPALGDIRKRLKTEARKAGFDGCEAQSFSGWRDARRKAAAPLDILCKQVDGSNTKVVDQIFLRSFATVALSFPVFAGSDIPNPRISSAQTRCRDARMGMSLENAHHVSGKPWTRMTGVPDCPQGNIMQACVAEI